MQSHEPEELNKWIPDHWIPPEFLKEKVHLLTPFSSWFSPQIQFLSLTVSEAFAFFNVILMDQLTILS